MRGAYSYPGGTLGTNEWEPGEPRVCGVCGAPEWSCDGLPAYRRATAQGWGASPSEPGSRSRAEWEAVSMAEQAGAFVTNETICLAADGTTVVPCTDPRAAYQLARAGSVVDAATAEKYGLTAPNTAKQSPPASRRKSVAGPPDDKALTEPS